MAEMVLQYILVHGYSILFLAFVAELLALPIPGETVMGYIGYLSYEGEMNYVAAIVAVYLGVCTGITMAHLLGRKLGYPFFRKYGHYIHLGPEGLDRAADWFDKYGYGLLVIAYFIPGIRHISGYFSGIMKMPFRLFAAPAFIGALLYAGVFITLGRILGPDMIVGIIAALGLLAFCLFKSRKS